VAVLADPPRIALRTLGCRVNRTESEALAEALGGACTVAMDSDDGADVVVINTCTVTGEADAKARKAVRHALGHGASTVVVTGCLAVMDPHGLLDLDPRVVVVPAGPELARRVAELAGVDIECGPRPVTHPGGLGRIRVMVKVQDGCDHRCSYCIVPDARGVARSVPTADVLERVRALAASGVPEVVLTGVNIGRYGDPTGARDLASLIAGVAATAIGRVHLSSIEPLDLDERLLGILSGSAKVVPHLHVPLQSGCDRTLAAMARSYGADGFARALAAARAALPDLSVTTDVIAGFPGETDADFAESLSFVENADFTRLHVFRYSARPGTPAAARTDQVAPEVKAARAQAMREASQELLRTHADARVGTEVTMCIERVRGDMASGTADDSLPVEVPAPGRVRGQVVRVRIDEADGRGYRGAVLESS
jgi:threonylcarbamoyladenosine tRNA methylthiotransferase MtaB